jgi:hypothetical protein
MSSNQQLSNNAVIVDHMRNTYFAQGVEYILQAVHIIAQTDKAAAAALIGVSREQIECISNFRADEIREGAAKITSISLPIPEGAGLEVFFGNSTVSTP